ncbi:peroxiredoxin-like 2C [Ptychodera flava]|uniref:peroxiredoxin-like 2C n=1 Tax=Ptychodera flava TaxID=63121 RepID=UPI00396A0BFB
MASIDRGTRPTQQSKSVNLYIPTPDPPGPHVDFDHIAKMPVWDENGDMIPFEYLYSKEKAIIVFLRFFQCYTSIEYAQDLAKIPVNYLKEAGVRLIVIGCIPWNYIKSFKGDVQFPHEVYVDQEKNIYKALKLRTRSTEGGSQSSPHVKSSILGGIFKSTWKIMRFNSFKPDINQLGGQLILGPGQVESFYHIDRNMLDHTPINRLLAIAGVQQVNFDKHKRILQL